MNMNDNGQDKRPVYMGTFTKLMKTHETKISALISEIEENEKKIFLIKKKIEKIERVEKTLKVIMICGVLVTVAILLLEIFM
jgi:cell division protein FtsL